MASILCHQPNGKPGNAYQKINKTKENMLDKSIAKSALLMLAIVVTAVTG
ncbi:MAG TPA: hypothetical protein PLS51_00700 [Flavobacterium sp.]|nr:hypothetical protein [Flavobacterium sp.]HPJ09116.1 hypothetical protein [Flavobacterium sp.]